MTVPVSGTEGYAEEAEALVKQYENLAFAETHRLILHLIPSATGRVVDIGAGTGRDAAGFAALGHDVVAVEPTAEMRTRAMALHPSPRIEWLDDSLPDLAQLTEYMFDGAWPDESFSILGHQALLRQEAVTTCIVLGSAERRPPSPAAAAHRSASHAPEAPRRLSDCPRVAGVAPSSSLHGGMR